MNLKNKHTMSEIELYDAQIVDDKIIVDYAVFEGETIANVRQELRPVHVANFIDDEGLNYTYYQNEPDELHEIPTCIYLVENLREMVKMYLEHQFKAA